MSTTTLNVRTDCEVKRRAEAVFNELGLTLTTAINVFLKAAVRKNGLPFALSLDKSDNVTLVAIEEGRKIAHDPNIKGYSDMTELRAALES